ncbi:MAG: ribosome silencing factor [Thermostichales cyanobacterium SZTDM-1c_bins_54]
MPLPDPTYQLALTAVAAADERQGGEILVLDVNRLSTLADYFIVITGYSTTQIRAIVRAIEEKVLLALGQAPRRIEGMGSATWVLMDYADVIIHIMLPREREFYDLESFWGHAPRVSLPIAG